MKIIREEEINPDFLNTINKQKTIIICLHPIEEHSIHELDEFPDTFKISLSQDINLSASNVIRISPSTLSAIARPKLKMCIPSGIKIKFEDFIGNPTQDIFWKIYRSFNHYAIIDDENNISRYIVGDFMFTMYIDTIRMREAGLQMLIEKGTPISEFYFSWYLQTKSELPQIDNIYLLINKQVYDDFVNIF